MEALFILLFLIGYALIWFLLFVFMANFFALAFAAWRKVKADFRF